MYRPCPAPTFKPATTAECLARGRAGALVLALLAIAWVITLGSAVILCRIRQLRFRMQHCRQGNTDGTIDLGFTLGGWVDATPQIRRAIVWRDHRGEFPFSELEAGGLWTRIEAAIAALGGCDRVPAA